MSINCACVVHTDIEQSSITISPYQKQRGRRGRITQIQYTNPTPKTPNNIHPPPTYLPLKYEKLWAAWQLVNAYLWCEVVVDGNW